MTIEEKIKVMQHFADGGEVEYSTRGTAMEEFCGVILDENEWSSAANPTWDWKDKLYRIKPEPQKPEDRIEAEYPEFDVDMLTFSEGILIFNRYFRDYPHNLAQSIKGFAGYVYLDNDEELIEHIHPVLELGFGRLHPIAVLFTKDSKEEA